MANLFGGSSQDYAYSIVLGELCYAYVAGYTHSTDYPTTSDAYDTENNLGDDVFITKFQIPGAFFRDAGDSNNYAGNSVIQTSDVGYLIGGETKIHSNGGYDMAMYRLKSDGTK